MRADRLLALLLLLQGRGRMTGRELADALEVSERTVYRDLEALSAAGVPVLAERGPGGGCALPPGYRTTLTGLTEGEVQALFLAATPGPLADLGLQAAREGALLKLAAALPAVQRGGLARVRERLHLDPAPWFRPAEPVPHLPLLQEAVWQERRLHLTYQHGDGRQSERAVDPYGLVAKGSVWYLVAAAEGTPRAYRVSRIQAAALLDAPFARPAGFDLPAWWAAFCAEFEGNLPQYSVALRFDPAFLPELPLIYGEGMRAVIAAAPPPDAGGWVPLTLTFERFEAALINVLGFAAAAEVVAPADLRAAVAATAARIAAIYQRET